MEPFEISIPEADLDDLRARLTRTRWADDIGNDDWRYGVERQWLEGMVGYWRDEYDWRAAEAEMNRLPQFRVVVDDVPIHFVHVRGTNPDPVPLLLLHGWPWTFMDFEAMIGPLTDSFDLIIPSLPGFGFSTPLTTTGVTVPVMAELFMKLLTDVLGYDRFGVAGGDFGAMIALQLAHDHPDHVTGVFTTIPIFPGLDFLALDAAQHAPDEGWMIRRRAEVQRLTASHFAVHTHDPQTLAYALVDSPVGTAAWIWERRRSWSDCDGDVLAAFDRDFLCTLASIYWLTGTIGTSLRLYWDNLHLRRKTTVPDGQRSIEVPAGFAIHPKEVMLVPRSLVAAGTDLRRWTVMPRGGHFAFAEEPAALTAELRSFFDSL